MLAQLGERNRLQTCRALYGWQDLGEPSMELAWGVLWHRGDHEGIRVLPVWRTVVVVEAGEGERHTVWFKHKRTRFVVPLPEFGSVTKVHPFGYVSTVSKKYIHVKHVLTLSCHKLN